LIVDFAKTYPELASKFLVVNNKMFCQEMLKARLGEHYKKQLISEHASSALRECS